MLQEIFGECGTKKRLEINHILKDLYDGKYKTVEQALKYNFIKLSADKYEKLVELVAEVKQGGKREQFEIDEGSLVKYWYITDWDGERVYCVRINDEEEWKKAIALMVKIFHVDTVYGTIRSGLRKFNGPDIYIFGKDEVESICNDPDSNWYGSKSIKNFLSVESYQGRKLRYEEFLNSVVDREKDFVMGVLD